MTALPLPRIVAGVDSQRQVRVEVEIQGLYKSTPYGAIVDTGFSGGLSIPLIVAVGIGLEKTGATTITLADGSIKTVPLFLSKVRIGSTVVDVSTLVMGNDVLLGMEAMADFQICVSAGTGEVTVTEQKSLKRLKQLGDSLRRIMGG